MENEQRKLDHIRICLEQNVNAPGVTTGFETFVLPHRALPEINKHSIDTSTEFLGRRLKAPLIISAMTGGTELAARINKNLAIAAQRLGIAMGVGSQRAAIENEALAYSYQVRDVAPDILLFGNLGAVQLNYGYCPRDFQKALDMIGADGLFLHLNALQECIQLRGNTDFADLLPKIHKICDEIAAPILIKEVGNGMSASVALSLKDVGVKAIDVAGAGGTSWALVEKHRAVDPMIRRIADAFANWGIPTAKSLEMVRAALPDFPLIASGGIRSGLDVAKALILGADLAGIAAPLLRPATVSAEAVVEHLTQIVEELRIAMFCVGAANIRELRKTQLDRIETWT